MNLLRFTAIALSLFVISATAAPGDFNAVSGYGTRIEYTGQPDADANIGEMVLQNIVLSSETTEPDGKKRLAFTMSLHNSGEAYYEMPQIRLQPAGPDWNIFVVHDNDVMPDLPPGATVSLPQPIVLLTPAAEANAVKAQILAGQRLWPRALELFQFRLPPVAVDEVTTDAYSSAVPVLLSKHVRLYFSNSTPLLAGLLPGRLLMETPATHTVPRTFNVQGQLTGLAAYVSMAERYVEQQEGQIRSTRMVEILSVATLGSGEIEVLVLPHGGEIQPFIPIGPLGDVEKNPNFRGFIDNLVIGTFSQDANDAFDVDPGGKQRHPTDPPVGNSVFGAFETLKRIEARRGYLEVGRVRHPSMADLNGFFVVHMPLNDFEIAKGLKLDGEVLLDGINIKIKSRHRRNLPPKLIINLTSKLELNLRLTAKPGSDTSGLPELELKKTLALVPGPILYFSIGVVPVKIQPILEVKIGAGITTPMEVVIPFQGSYESGLQYVWDDSKPQGQKVEFKPFSKIRPLALSLPQLADSLALEAYAFAEASVTLLINDLAGPFIGTRASASFTASPLANLADPDVPWWQNKADFDITGGFKIALFGLTLAEVGAPLFPVSSLFANKSTGPPSGGSGVPGGSPPGPHDPVEGGNTRWAKTLQWADGPSPYNGVLAKATGASQDIFMALNSAFDVRPPIVRLDPRGQILWSTGAQLVNPQQLAATPDGGVVVLSGFSSSIFLTRLDAAGNVLWVQSVRPTEDNGGQKFFTLTGLVVRPLAGGQIEVFVGGEQNNNLATLDADPYLMKFDDAGNLLWSKRYPSLNMVEGVKQMILLRDGNLCFVGSAKGNSDGSPPGAGAAVGGWLMKVQPDGEVIWGVRSLGNILWNSVAESPDGKLFTGGTYQIFITSDLPAFTVARYSADGTMEKMVTVGEAMNNDAASSLPTFRDWLTFSGLTPYDVATKVAWTDSGLVACGTTGLGSLRAPFTILFTEKMSVRWMVTHEGPSEDVPFDLIPTADGIVQLGMTRSFGSLGILPITQLMKLPYEGTVAMHPKTNALAKFLQPSIYDLTAGQWDIGIVSPPQRYSGTETISYTVAALPTVAGPLAGPYAAIANFVSTSLEKGSASAPMTYLQWANYQQLPGGSASASLNLDGDARSNIEEYLFGGDPYSPDPIPVGLGISRRPDGGIHLETTRSRTARNTALSLGSGMETANQPFVYQDVTWTVIGTDPNQSVDILGYDLPPDPAPRKLFRLKYPLP